MNNIPENRRRPARRNTRRVVLAGNLLATLLEQFSSSETDNPVERSVRLGIQAWEIAVEDLRHVEQEAQP